MQILDLVALRHIAGQGLAEHRIILFNQLELQMGNPPDHINGLLTVCHARQLDQNLILALSLENGLAHTHAVDTVAQDLHGARDRIFLGLTGQLGGIHSQDKMHPAF